MNWPTISAGRRLMHQRLGAGVAEAAGQRAADLARHAHRAAISSGMLTVSASLPSGKRSSHLRAVDRALRFGHDLGRAMTNSSASRSRVLRAMLVMRSKSVTPCQ